MNVTRLDRMNSEDIRENVEYKRQANGLREEQNVVRACGKNARRSTGKESDDEQADRNKK